MSTEEMRFFPECIKNVGGQPQHLVLSWMILTSWEENGAPIDPLELYSSPLSLPRKSL